MTEPIRFTVFLNPVTKKNSGRIVRRGKFPKILPSEAFERYQEAAGYFVKHRGAGIDYPVNICATYYMQTRRNCA